MKVVQVRLVVQMSLCCWIEVVGLKVEVGRAREREEKAQGGSLQRLCCLLSSSFIRLNTPQ